MSSAPTMQMDFVRADEENTYPHGAFTHKGKQYGIIIYDTEIYICAPRAEGYRPRWDKAGKLKLTFPHNHSKPKDHSTLAGVVDELDIFRHALEAVELLEKRHAK